MKVADLIAELENMDQQAEVHFSYNYGDHWRTQVAPTVDRVDMTVVEYSAYHSMDKMVDHEDVYDEETGDFIEGVRRVVVLG